jgi:hypothetical protein
VVAGFDVVVLGGGGAVAVAVGAQASVGAQDQVGEGGGVAGVAPVQGAFGDGDRVVGDGETPGGGVGELGGGLAGDVGQDGAEAFDLAGFFGEHGQGGQVQVQVDGRLARGGGGGGAGLGGVDPGQEVGEGVGADLVQRARVAGGLGGANDAPLGGWFSQIVQSVAFPQALADGWTLDWLDQSAA